jgi:hypothetical protein
MLPSLERLSCLVVFSASHACKALSSLPAPSPIIRGPVGCPINDRPSQHHHPRFNPSHATYWHQAVPSWWLHFPPASRSTMEQTDLGSRKRKNPAQPPHSHSLLLTPTPSSSLRPLYSFFLFLIPLLPLPSLVPPYLHPTHHHCQSVRIRLLNNRFLNPPSSCSIQPAPLPILTSAPSYSVTTELSIVKHHVVPGLPSPAACPLPPLWQGICTVCMYILPPFHLEVVHTHPPLPFSAVTASCIHKGTMQAVQAVEIAFFHLIFQNACSVMPPFLLVDLPYVSLILSPTPPLSPPNVANEK